MQDVSQGVERNRAWPPKRKKRLPDITKEQNDWFREAQWSTKYWASNPYIQAMQAVKGTPLLPRDIMTMIMAGRLGYLVTVDGKVKYPMAAIQDISASLDVITRQAGYILRRGPALWEGVPQASGVVPWWFQPPLASAFTLAQGTASPLVLADDGDEGLLVQGPAPQTGDRNAIAYQTLANKNADWSLEIRASCLIPNTNWSGCGIVLMDSISGRLTSLSIRGDGTLNTINWTGLVGFNATVHSLTPSNRVQIQFLRVRRVGATTYFEISSQGKMWTAIGSVVTTGWLTNQADRVGLAIDYNRNTNVANQMSVGRYVLTQ